MPHAHDPCAYLMRMTYAHTSAKSPLCSPAGRHGMRTDALARERAIDSGLILSGATSGGEDFYVTPRARPGDTPEVFARVLPAAVFLGAAFARRRGLRPACAEALDRARAPPAGR